MGDQILHGHASCLFRIGPRFQITNAGKYYPINDMLVKIFTWYKDTYTYIYVISAIFTCRSLIDAMLAGDPTCHGSFGDWGGSGAACWGLRGGLPYEPRIEIF